VLLARVQCGLFGRKAEGRLCLSLARATLGRVEVAPDLTPSGITDPAETPFLAFWQLEPSFCSPSCLSGFKGARKPGCGSSPWATRSQSSDGLTYPHLSPRKGSLPWRDRLSGHLTKTAESGEKPELGKGKICVRCEAKKDLRADLPARWRLRLSDRRTPDSATLWATRASTAVPLRSLVLSRISIFETIKRPKQAHCR
jgi:hypothetical protein